MSAHHFVWKGTTAILWAGSRAACLKITVAGIRKVHPRTGYKGPEVAVLSFFKLGFRWGMGSQRNAPAALPLGMTWCRGLGGPQGRSKGVRKITPSQGLDPWTAQPLASRYTEHAIQAHNWCT